MLPAHADWGRLAPIWDTDGYSHQMALFPLPLGVSGPLVLIHQQREFSGKRGRVRDPLWGTCLWRERWLSYLERKTEVEEATLAPLPLLGARVQTAIGSALTVFFVGFETRPRGKQRECLLRRKAARCFQLPWIGMESLKGRPGGEAGAYLDSAFVNAELSGQSFSGRYPRVGVLLKERLQGVLLARLQSEPPPSRSCGDGACGRREEREASQTRAPGGGLGGGAQACSPPRGSCP